MSLLAIAALCAVAATAQNSAKVSVAVSSDLPPVHLTAPEYLSFNFNLDFHYDGEEWPAWWHSSVLNMSLLENTDLTYLAYLHLLICALAAGERVLLYASCVCDFACESQ